MKQQQGRPETAGEDGSDAQETCQQTKEAISEVSGSDGHCYHSHAEDAASVVSEQEVARITNEKTGKHEEEVGKITLGGMSKRLLSLLFRTITAV